jgi:hypothetical protein
VVFEDPASATALIASWGTVPDTYRPHEQTFEELQVVREAAARANKSKRRRLRCKAVK